MNTHKIAQALSTLSLAIGELAEALDEPPEPDVVPPRPVPVQGGAAGETAPPLPPLEDYPYAEDEPFPGAATDVEGVPLSQCPVHRKPWTIKPAGVNKAGKPYNAFWKCDARDADGYCDRKPSRAWQQTHPIPSAA